MAAGITGLHAAPCPAATLQVYIELGATGCTIGPSPTFTYSDFQFSAIGSGSTVTADQIGVTPLGTLPGGALSLGTAFASSGFSVVSGQTAEYIISYLVDPPPPEIIRFDSDFGDPATGSAFTEITTSLCIDLNCPRTGTLSIFENLPGPGGPSTKLSDSLGISPFTVVLHVSNDIVLDASKGGTASITGFAQRAFIDDTIPAPEPVSGGLIAAGLLCLGLSRTGAKRRKVFFKARDIVA